jgi:hypothetical protein
MIGQARPLFPVIAAVRGAARRAVIVVLAGTGEKGR